MAWRFVRPFIALALMVWLLSLVTALGPRRESWVHARGAAPAPVRILRFYSTTGSLTAGEKAMLCYSVENAKEVRIAPFLGNVFFSTNRCLEVGPLHTTHYTILAEGFDGHVATQSLTLAVEMTPAPGFQVALEREDPASCLVPRLLAAGHRRYNVT
jgi:hypothetical protein